MDCETNCSTLDSVIKPITPAEAVTIGAGTGYTGTSTSCIDVNLWLQKLKDQLVAIKNGDISVDANADASCHTAGIPTISSLLSNVEHGLEFLKDMICGITETTNTSPSNTILTTGTNGHTLDINVPTKGIACGLDQVIPLAEAEYTQVEKKADGTLWNRGRAIIYNTAYQSPYLDTSSGPYNAAGPIPVFTTATTQVSSITIVNPSNCRPMLLDIYSQESYSNSTSQINNSFITLFRQFIDFGSGALTLVRATYTTSTNINSQSLNGTSESFAHTPVILAAGATVTLRVQSSIESFSATTNGTMACGGSLVIRGRSI
jgi:hypothetical protein